MKNLIIIGVGGFAREVFGQAHDAQGFGVDWQIKGFLDGDVKLATKDYELLPAKLLGDINSYEICADDVFTCAIGTPSARRNLSEKILNRGGKFINIINKLAYVLPTVELGQGVIISPHTDIGDRAKIGDFVATNALTIIGHDAQIGNYSCIMPHAVISGKCKIGAEVFIGSGAIILPKAKVGNGATIGAGSVVLKKVREGVTVFGNPAIEI